MMVPAHIEQECNAFDAVNSGAGITADRFSLLKLLEFLPSYQPNTGFIDWVSKGNFLFINNLGIADC
jgi:hypothetical protein